jgi:hypothetical protein
MGFQRQAVLKLLIYMIQQSQEIRESRKTMVAWRRVGIIISLIIP